MASGEDPCPAHPERTQHRNYAYCFYFAHHGRGAPDDSQWAEDLTQAEEFAIFDESDWHDLFDSTGHYYGLRRSPDGTILDLGTDGEQIAKIWKPQKDQPTHGFPLWPLAESGAANRKKTVVPREALRKMQSENLIGPTQLKRLLKGDRAK